MKKLKLLVATLLISLPAFVPVAVSAQFNPIESTCDQISNADQSEICAPAASGEDPIKGDRSVFVVVADVLTIAAGAIAVVMIIISGITMITSSGDPAKIKKSRDTIIYAVAGIFVVILSRSIVLFIIGQIS